MTERKEDVKPEPGGFTRRSLIAGSAGVATTVAVTAVAPAAAAAVRREAPATPVPTPTTPIPPDSSFSYDGAADAVTDGLTFDNYLPNFPYLGLPYSGYDVPSS